MIFRFFGKIKMQKIFIFGATGFFGAKFVKFFTAKNLQFFRDDRDVHRAV